MEALLTVLETLIEHLRQLTDLAKRKTLAVRKSDLTTLNQILKEEQAQSLALRGLEQKRMTLLRQVGLDNISLTALPTHMPIHLQQRTREIAETLRHEFAIYNSAAEVARNTLECNLHEVEKFLAAAGAVSDAGTGYRRSDGDVDAPPKLKADFRA